MKKITLPFLVVAFLLSGGIASANETTPHITLTTNASAVHSEEEIAEEIAEEVSEEIIEEVAEHHS